MKYIFIFVVVLGIGIMPSCRTFPQEKRLENGFVWARERIDSETERVTISLQKGDRIRVITDALVEDGNIRTFSPTVEQWAVAAYWDGFTESDYSLFHLIIHNNGTVTQYLGDGSPFDFGKFSDRTGLRDSDFLVHLSLDESVPIGAFLKTVEDAVHFGGGLIIDRYIDKQEEPKTNVDQLSGRR